MAETLKIFRSARRTALCACLALCAAQAWADNPVQSPADSGPRAGENVPHVPLTREIVYQVLAAEIAAQRNMQGAAYRTLMALARDTKDPRLAMRAMEIALEGNMRGEALNAARLWNSLSPASANAAQFFESLLALTGKWDEVGTLAQARLEKTSPRQRPAAILQLQQNVSALAGKSMAAVDALQQVLAPYSQYPETHLAMARARASADDRPGALADLERALQVKPGFEPAVLMAAELEEDNRPAAIRRLQQHLQLAPRHRDARVLLARLLIANDQIEAARAEFETVLRLHGEDPHALAALGLVDMQRKDYDSAERLFRRYLAQVEKLPGQGRQHHAGLNLAYQNLAQIAEARGQHQAAADWLDKTEGEEPRSLMRMRQAQMLAKAGKLPEAMALIARLREDAQASGDMRRIQALARAEVGLLLDSKNYTAALAQLEDLLRGSPDDPDLLYEYAMTAERLERLDLMERTLRRVIQIAPDKPHAFNALGYTFADRGERLDEALQLIRRAIALAPEDPQIIDSLGWVLYRLGRHQEALVELKRAWEKMNDPEIGAHLGEVLWTLGRAAEARAVWREALGVGLGNDTLKRTIERFEPSLAGSANRP